MSTDLESEKYEAEIEKLRLEIDSIKHPLSRPLNWIPICIALISLVTAGYQWQSSNLTDKQAALKAEIAEFNLKKQQNETKDELTKINKELNLALQNKKIAEKHTLILINQQKNLQTKSRDLQKQISIHQVKFDELSIKLEELDTTNLNSDLSQLNEIIHSEIPSSNTNASGQTYNEIRRLIATMNSNITVDRIRATESLIEHYGDDNRAVVEVLSQFNPDVIDQLSASGRINMLVFLASTSKKAWKENSQKLAREKIAFIRSRQNQGIKIGKTTRKRITELELFLSNL